MGTAGRERDRDRDLDGARRAGEAEEEEEEALPEALRRGEPSRCIVSSLSNVKDDSTSDKACRRSCDGHGSRSMHGLTVAAVATTARTRAAQYTHTVARLALSEQRRSVCWGKGGNKQLLRATVRTVQSLAPPRPAHDGWHGGSFLSI